MQVTLMSSDAEVFEVPRKVAEMSNTVKDIVDGTLEALKMGDLAIPIQPYISSEHPVNNTGLALLSSQQ